MKRIVCYLYYIAFALIFLSFGCTKNGTPGDQNSATSSRKNTEQEPQNQKLEDAKSKAKSILEPLLAKSDLFSNVKYKFISIPISSEKNFIEMVDTGSFGGLKGAFKIQLLEELRFENLKLRQDSILIGSIRSKFDPPSIELDKIYPPNGAIDFDSFSCKTTPKFDGIKVTRFKRKKKLYLLIKECVAQKDFVFSEVKFKAGSYIRFSLDITLDGKHIPTHIISSDEVSIKGKIYPPDTFFCYLNKSIIPEGEFEYCPQN